MGSAHFFLDVFLRDISHRRHSTWTFSRNKFPLPSNKPWLYWTTLHLRSDYRKPNNRTNTRIFWHWSMDLCSARSPKRWQPQYLSSSWRIPVAILSAGLVTTVIANYLVNCVYFCLCSVVEEYDLMFFVVLIWDIFDVHHVPWCAAPKRPAAGKIAQKVAKYGMQFFSKIVFSICLGIHKSTEHNSESKKYYSRKTERGLLKP